MSQKYSNYLANKLDEHLNKVEYSKNRAKVIYDELINDESIKTELDLLYRKDKLKKIKNKIK